MAFHAAQLGDRGVIVTRVGNDAAGSELVAFLHARGVVTEHAQRDPARPTGTVLVAIAGGEPRYTITEGVAWDHLDAELDACAQVRAADAVVVGTLAQRSTGSRVAIRTLLAEARGRAVIVFDVNLRPPFVDAGVVEATCRAADVVKMNDAEAAALGSLLGRPALVPWLMDEVGVQGAVERGHRRNLNPPGRTPREAESADEDKEPPP